MQQHPENEWIEHDGEEMPVAGDTLVNIKTADGDTAFEWDACPAEIFGTEDTGCDWWTGENCHDWRIIAYRVVSK